MSDCIVFKSGTKLVMVDMTAVIITKDREDCLRVASSLDEGFKYNDVSDICSFPSAAEALVYLETVS